MDWFEENGIDITDWPPFSPDLNPIEHTQKALKEMVFKMFLEVWTAVSKREGDLRAMEEALKAAQDALPDSLFESLIKSIPKRIQAYIKAKGWYTKYQRAINEGKKCTNYQFSFYL